MSEHAPQPTYTIKPPTWRGTAIDMIGFRIGYDRTPMSGVLFAYDTTGGHALPATEAEAKAWCEAEYYSWIKNFLEEQSPPGP